MLKARAKIRDGFDSQEQPWIGRKLHFVGIGGAGMSGLALIAHKLGAEVTGSDQTGSSPYLESIREIGIAPMEGHVEQNVPAEAELVISTAISPENPERAIARSRGQRELHRADLLGELTRLKPTIAVSGTHGKTTTSAMIIHALRESGADPSFVLGAQLHMTGLDGRTQSLNADWGSGEWLVVEADESDRSLLKLSPDIAVITNAELDHHTTYSSLQHVLDTFREFLAPAEKVVLWDRPELVDLVSQPERAQRLVTFDVVDPTLTPEGASFIQDGVQVEVPLPGQHNANNAAAALSACRLRDTNGDGCAGACHISRCRTAL